MKIFSFFKRLNQMELTSLLAVMLMIIGHSSICYAQAPVDGFFKGKGNIVAGLGAGVDLSDTYFAGTREIALTRNGVTGSLFGIAGLHDNLDISAAIPVVLINGNGGLQDASLYLKYRALDFEMTNSKLELSLAAGISAPLADYETEASFSIGQQATVIDFRPILHFQTNSGWFATGQFGYQVKSDPTPSSTSMAFKFGRAQSEHYYDVWYTNQFADGGLDYRSDDVLNSFKELGSDFHKVGVTYYRPISEKLGVYVGGNSVLAGRNISKGFGASLGAVLSLK
jgi:hypothetical protein